MFFFNDSTKFQLIKIIYFKDLIMKTSYKLDDVQFLLKDLTEVALKNKADGIDDFAMSIEEKEKAIQSNLKHYSEIVNLEKPPTKEYLNIYYKVLKNRNVMNLFTDDILTLTAKMLSDIQLEYEKTKDKNVILVSLVRAGTPIGILLKRILEQQDFIRNNNINLKHYSVSIIRDKGIDENAINHIIQENQSENIYFIDGWTGKGVITKELTNAIHHFNHKYQTNLKDTLYVLADIVLLPNVKAGSYLDYLIPSSILNSTISGLISRTILNHLIKPNDFHGSIYYEDLKQHDLSNDFINYVMAFIQLKNKNLDLLPYLKRYHDMYDNKNNNDTFELKNKRKKFLEQLMITYHYPNMNYIKPGVNEATRVMLRRYPEKLFIQNMNDSNIQHLVQLANEKNIEIEVVPDMPYRAVALIKGVALDN